MSKYFSLVKFSHTIFAMPFAMIGFSLAVLNKWELRFLDSNMSGELSFHKFQIIKLLILVILCMIFARNAAMAFNRYIDEKFDKLNPRTAIREIPAGIISKQNAFLFVLINSILFIVVTYFINSLCFYLSPIALFVILFYSYTKRFTPLCHLVLGLGLSLAPIGAYISVTNQFHILPILFSLTVLTWVSGFDILYSLQDEDFDREHHLKSIPVLLGRKNALFTSRILHFISAMVVLMIGMIYLPFALYYIAASIFIFLLIYQHTLVKVNDISKVNIAFATTNGIASVAYSIFVILSLYFTF
ncbi:MAG: UbiA family prenyltransferase [Chitinophagaceae bacterium]|nr:UbiA family prenyltransferase [Chitinophagaceae bacterium]